MDDWRSGEPAHGGSQARPLPIRKRTHRTSLESGRKQSFADNRSQTPQNVCWQRNTRRGWTSDSDSRFYYNDKKSYDRDKILVKF